MRQNTSTLSLVECGEDDDLLQHSKRVIDTEPGMIAEVPEHSSCSKSNAAPAGARDKTNYVKERVCNQPKKPGDTSAKKPLHIGNPFQFIWNIKSASYECARTLSKYRKKTSTL